ncbi:MAG: (2Fe-2S) ferredoxin domain-containing protein [Kiritimatiellia bacterium]|jgi:(2Fe-2S) ferredoxin|nr:(2Fe-2S) ferredoxin domain-containing protein [Kiritimatiellia bacterium]
MDRPIEGAPYRCHVFVCVNDRHGARKSCADGNAGEIRLKLKEAVKAKGWLSTDIRVSQSLCMGLCERGPNVLVYPQGMLFSAVRLQDVDAILAEIEKIMATS